MPILRTIVGVATLSLAGVAATRADAVISPIVRYRTGQTAPGTAGVFSAYLLPTVSPAGEVLFYGRSSDNQSGLWRLNSSSPELVIKSINGFPPAGEFYYDVNGRFTISSNGAVAFQANRRDSSGTVLNGVFYWENGVVTPHFANGIQAPGLPAGVKHSGAASAGWAGMDGTGRQLFTTALAGPGVTSSNNYALFIGKPASTQLIARVGDAAPGTSSFFAAFDALRIVDSGRYALGARVGGFSGPTGIWTGTGTTLKPAVIAGDTAVGGNGQAFFSVGLDCSSRNGTFAFSGVLGSATGTRGVWKMDASDQVSLVTMAGNGVIDRPGFTIVSPGPAAAVSDNGRAIVPAYTGTAANNQTESLLFIDPSGARVIARRGESVPGTNSHFLSLGVNASNTSVEMNAVGQVLFSTALDTDGQFGRTIFSFTELDGLKRQVGTGDLLEFSPGVFKTVSEVRLGTDLFGSDSGINTGLLDSGEYWFRAVFTDNSIATMTAVIPAPPAAFAMGVLALPVLLRRSRRSS